MPARGQRGDSTSWDVSMLLSKAAKIAMAWPGLKGCETSCDVMACIFCGSRYCLNIPLLWQAGQISEDDYFSRNPEFSSWLTAEKGQYFNQLTAEESRELFAKFVSRWNAKKLPAKYYAGVAAPANMRRTAHNWGIRGQPPPPPPLPSLSPFLPSLWTNMRCRDCFYLIVSVS